MLQFGERKEGRDYAFRATAFGLVMRDGLLACVTVDRGANSYLDLPGGAVDGEETEAEALVREFVEETGLIISAEDRLVEAAQYVLKTDGRAVNNTGGFWTGMIVHLDTAAKVEDDHTLTWIEPGKALRSLRHEAHAWAVACLLRRREGTRLSTGG